MRRHTHIVLLVCIVAVVGIPVVTAQNGDSTVFTLDVTLYSEGGGELRDYAMESGYADKFRGHDAYEPTHRLVVTDRNGEQVFTQDLHVRFEIHPYGQEHYPVPERNFTWQLPYHEDAKNITLYDLPYDAGHNHSEHDHSTDDTGERETVFSIDLEEEFCQSDGECPAFCDGKGVDIDCSCGDGLCQPHESEDTCPEDCAADTGGEDPGAGQDDGGFSLLFIGMGVIVLLVIGVLVLYVWRGVDIE